MDNPAPTGTTVDPAATTVVPEPVVPVPAFTWKSNLLADYAGSPTMQKFPDTKDGFNDFAKSHLSLEKMLGNEKVPIPKGPDDLAAKAIFNKAMGIPTTADGYALPDIDVPDSLKGLTFDKAKFQEAVFKRELTPTAAKGLWDDYTKMAKEAYADALKKRNESLTGMINGLRSEWGEAYQSKVELGQMVINKFSADKEMSDFLTAILTQDPRGIKFLASVGDQFAENKIGDFKYQRHSLTPEEAQNEIDIIKRDMKHPYNDPKATEAEHNRAVDYVNSLISVARKPRG